MINPRLLAREVALCLSPPHARSCASAQFPSSRYPWAAAATQDDGLREEMGAVAREADALPAGGGPGVRGRAAYAAGLAAAMLTGFGR